MIPTFKWRFNCYLEFSDKLSTAGATGHKLVKIQSSNHY